MAQPTATVTIRYMNGAITVDNPSVEIKPGGTVTFIASGADVVIICGDNASEPEYQNQGWFVDDDTTGKNDKNNIAFFVPNGGSRDVRVKNQRAILVSPYCYSVVALTTDANGERDKVLHSIDPTVIIRDN